MFAQSYEAAIAHACLGRVLAPEGGELGSGGDGPGQQALGRRTQPCVIPAHVLVTMDGSEPARRALPMALAAIRACGSPRVTLLRVLTPDKDPSPVHALEWALARAQAEADLRRSAAEFELPSIQVETVVVEGRVAEQILRFIETSEVDLLVLASHGSDDARDWPMGGVARKLVHSSNTSVLVVPSDAEPKSLERVLVPLDCSVRAECVLPLLPKLAEAHDPLFCLAHVVPEPEISHRLPAGSRDSELVNEITTRNRQRAELYFRSLCERMRGRGVRAETVLLSDTNPARVLERYASELGVGLALLSAHGAAGDADEAYGSVTRRLLDSLLTPLWIVQDLPPNSGERNSSVRLDDA